jgi:hypothetical protein
MRNLNKKLKLNKEAISSLENEEMNKLLAGADEPNCWKSRVLCGNTGLQNTCRTKSCTNDDNWEICLICIPIKK